MAKQKLKKQAANVPQSMTEANTLLGEIGNLQRQIDLINLAEVERIADLKAEFQNERSSFESEIKQKFADLCSWAEANKDELLKGGKRQLRMPQGLIGWRWGNPKVSVSKAALQGVIATFRKFDLTELLRTSIDIDKAAILKAPTKVDGIEGVKVVQNESFFAKPLDVETEREKTVQKLTGSDVLTDREPAPESRLAS